NTIEFYSADVTGVELNCVQAPIHIEPGRVDGRAGEIGIGSPMDSTVIARQEDAGGAGDEGKRVLIHVHAIVRRAITASGIIPNEIPVGPEPDLEGVEKDAVRIVRINGNALVVPVLRIVARRGAAVSEGSARRAGDLSPGYAAVGCAV